MITSGYVSKIPIINLSNKSKVRLGEIAQSAYTNKVSPKYLDKIIQDIDTILFEELQLSNEIKIEIQHFASNLQSRV